MATIVVTARPIIIGIKFLFANSIGLTPQIAAAAISDHGTKHPPPTHIAAICPNAVSAPTLTCIAVPNTDANEPAKTFQKIQNHQDLL